MTAQATAPSSAGSTAVNRTSLQTSKMPRAMRTNSLGTPPDST